MLTLKKPRRRATDSEILSVLEMAVASALEGINEESADRQRILRWVFNCENGGMPFSFDEACRAIPYDPDIFRDAIEGMFPQEVFEATEHLYGNP